MLSPLDIALVEVACMCLSAIIFIGSVVFYISNKKHNILVHFNKYNTLRYINKTTNILTEINKKNGFEYVQFSDQDYFKKGDLCIPLHECKVYEIQL
jgi:hypothetical protein